MTKPLAQPAIPGNHSTPSQISPAELGQSSSAEMQAEHTAMRLAWLAGICAALSPPAAFKKAQTHTSQKVHASRMRRADHPLQTQAAIIVETAFYSHARLRNGPAANDASTAVLKRAALLQASAAARISRRFSALFCFFSNLSAPFLTVATVANVRHPFTTAPLALIAF